MPQLNPIYAYLNVENPPELLYPSIQCGQIHGQCGHPTGTSQAKGMLWGAEAPTGEDSVIFYGQFASTHLGVWGILYRDHMA